MDFIIKKFKFQQMCSSPPDIFCNNFLSCSSDKIAFTAGEIHCTVSFPDEAQYWCFCIVAVIDHSCGNAANSVMFLC